MNLREKKYNYSEIFGETFQGEGFYTGTNTVWVRFFGCNKTCAGFNNNINGVLVVPEEELYYNKIDITDITDIMQLPTCDVGCDSYYSWHPRFKHLAKKKTASEIADELITLNKNEYNPDGLFTHPRSGQQIHLCFTGGESMMNQTGIIDIVQNLKNRNNYPRFVTIETNGTVPIKPEVLQFIISNTDIEFFWSISPKLFSVSAETKERSIIPGVVYGYYQASNKGQLKFVSNNSDTSWDEIESAILDYRQVGVDYDIWIMPEGASADAQSRHDSEIAIEAVKRGYYFSAIVHAMVFGACPGK